MNDERDMSEINGGNDGRTLVIGTFLAGAIILMVIVIAGSLFSGCVYKGAKAVDGTNMTVGFNVPGTDGALQISLLEYISGMRIATAEQHGLTITRSFAASNSYFGVIHHNEATTIDVRVTPSAVATNDVSGAASAKTR